MKFFMHMNGNVVGPYLPEEIIRLFGGVSKDTLVWLEAEQNGGLARWRAISLVPELADCIKLEISEPLAKYAPDSVRGISLKILSTDDDSNIRALLWHMLTDAGHTVEFAKDGEEVFSRLAAKNYDLVILDVNMPKMNGYKVSELLHKRLHNPPKVIIFTGRDIEKERLQFMCSEADAILNKGTGNDKLIQTIENLFSEEPEKPPELHQAVIEELSAKVSILPPLAAAPEPAPIVPITLLKEGFYSSADQEKSTQPAKVVPQQTTETEVEKPAATGSKTDEKALPAAPSPVSDRESGGRPDFVFNQLILENKGLKSELADIKRLLGHIESDYAQLEGQFKKQVLEILAQNQKIVQKLETNRQNMRYMTLTTLLLFVVILGDVFLR